jgi:hypothetical protein
LIEKGKRVSYRLGVRGEDIAVVLEELLDELFGLGFAKACKVE